MKNQAPTCYSFKHTAEPNTVWGESPGNILRPIHYVSPSQVGQGGLVMANFQQVKCAAFLL